MKIQKYIATLLLVKVALLSGSAFATYEKKVDDIRGASVDALELLKSARSADTLNKKSALKIIREQISPQFDYPYITRSVLAKSWRTTTAEQREMITKYFQQLIEKTYASSLAKFNNEKVDFLDPVEFRGKVKAGIIVTTSTNKVKIEYQLDDDNGEWKISDIRIENVSLVSNFRRQFKSVMRGGGPEALITMLKSKI